MERAFAIIYREQIPFAWSPLPDDFNGVYWRCSNGAKLIMIADRLRAGPSYLLRSVLYEEIGHDQTYRPLGTWTEYITYSRMVARGIREARALRWAAAHIIQPPQWREARRLGIETIPELAEYWDVTTEMADIIVQVWSELERRSHYRLGSAIRSPA